MSVQCIICLVATKMAYQKSKAQQQTVAVVLNLVITMFSANIPQESSPAPSVLVLAVSFGGVVASLQI